MNNIEHKSLKLLITGASGSGKTNAFIKFIYGTEYDHYFIFDHQDELLSRLSNKGIELEPFLNFKDIDDYYLELEDETENNDAVSNVIIFDPSVNYAGEYEDCFEYFCGYVFELCNILEGKKLFVCDELQILTGNLLISKNLQKILQTGRRKALDCAFCSQAPNELHNKIRNQITDLIVFRTLDDRALKWIRDIQLSDPERLMTLPDGEAIHYRTKTSEEETIYVDLAT